MCQKHHSGLTAKLTAKGLDNNGHWQSSADAFT